MINIRSKGPPMSIQIVIVQHLQHEQQLKGIRRWKLAREFTCSNNQVNTSRWMCFFQRVHRILITFVFSHIIALVFLENFHQTYASVKHLQQSPMHLHIFCYLFWCFLAKLSTCWSTNLRTLTNIAQALKCFCHCAMFHSWYQGDSWSKCDNVMEVDKTLSAISVDWKLKKCDA